MAEADTLPPDTTPPGIIPDTDIDSSGPIEIDIDTGEVDEAPPPSPAPAPAAQTPPAAPEPRVPRTQARIQTLSKEKQRLEAELAQAREEAARANQAAAEAAAARDTAERSGMENYGARVKADLAAAEQELSTALTSNDASLVVAAQKKLAKAAAAEADFDAWHAAHPKQEQQQRQPQQQPQQQRQPPQQQQPQISEPVLNFMREQEWFNPFQIDDNGMVRTDARGQPLENPNFDPEMRDAALLRDAQIKRQIRLGQKPADFLESEDYFSDIVNTVATTFPDAFEDGGAPPPPPPPQQRPRAPQMQPARQPVAPAQRQAMPGQNPQKPGNRVQLSGEERGLVDSLVENGTMRYSREHPDATKRGQKMTKQDAYVRYAKERAADQASRGNGGQ